MFILFLLGKLTRFSFSGTSSFALQDQFCALLALLELVRQALEGLLQIHLAGNFKGTGQIPITVFVISSSLLAC